MPYYELAPNRIYQNQYTYTRGNTSLVPSIEHYLEVSFILKNNWNFYYSYDQVKKYIEYITQTDERDPMTKYSIPQNTGKIRGHALGLDGNINLASWWKINTDIMLKHGTRSFTEIQNRHKVKRTFLYGHVRSLFDFRKDWGFSVQFHIESRDRADDKLFYKVGDLGFQAYKYFLNKRLALFFTSLPLLSKRRDTQTDTPELISYQYFKTSQTNFNLRLSYYFQLGKKIPRESVEKMEHIRKIIEKQ